MIVLQRGPAVPVLRFETEIRNWEIGSRGRDEELGGGESRTCRGAGGSMMTFARIGEVLAVIGGMSCSIMMLSSS